MIHVRDGRNPIDHQRFNEAFMMHASTSPFYPIIASNDISAAMMDGPGGKTLTDASIREAVSFRKRWRGCMLNLPLPEKTGFQCLAAGFCQRCRKRKKSSAV